MARNPHEFSKTPEPAPRIGAHRVFGRISLRAHERADLIAPGLPPELAFLPAAGFSSEQLLDAVGAAPRTIRPVDALLSEGIIREEAYYRALARHLGCQYYWGEPPFARSFDAIKGLRCGVAPLDSRGEGPRAVIAPRAESVPLLIEASQSGRIRSGSFALTSPQCGNGSEPCAYTIEINDLEDIVEPQFGRDNLQGISEGNGRTAWRVARNAHRNARGSRRVARAGGQGTRGAAGTRSAASP